MFLTFFENFRLLYIYYICLTDGEDKEEGSDDEEQSSGEEEDGEKVKKKKKKKKFKEEDVRFNFYQIIYF